MYFYPMFGAYVTTNNNNFVCFTYERCLLFAEFESAKITMKSWE